MAEISNDQSFVRSIKIIDTCGVLNKHRTTEDDLLDLCGGVPTGVTFVNMLATCLSEDSIKVEIDTDLFTSFKTIDFEAKNIYNAGLRVYEKNNGIGTSLFLNQVRVARDQGFSGLTLFAKGNDAYGDWDGAYRWGRVGFEMDIEDQNEFLDLMKRFSRTEKTLGELLKTEDGRVFWRTTNFTWYGYFDLSDSSSCMNYLADYLKEKNINIDL